MADSLHRRDDDPNPVNMTSNSHSDSQQIPTDDSNNNPSKPCFQPTASKLPAIHLLIGKDCPASTGPPQNGGHGEVPLSGAPCASVGDPKKSHEYTEGARRPKVETLRFSVHSDTYLNPETGLLHNLRVPRNCEEQHGMLGPSPSVICLPLHQVSPDTTVSPDNARKHPQKDLNNNKRAAPPDSQNGSNIQAHGSGNPNPPDILGTYPAKRPRKMYAPEQIEILEKSFLAKPYPTAHDRTTISMFTNLSTEKIKVWFQNRRSRERRRRKAQIQAQNKALALTEKAAREPEPPKLKPITTKSEAQSTNPNTTIPTMKEKIVTAAMGAPKQPPWAHYSPQCLPKRFPESPPPTPVVQMRDANNNSNQCVDRNTAFGVDKNCNNVQNRPMKIENQTGGMQHSYSPMIYQAKIQPVEHVKNEPTYTQLMPAWTQAWPVIPPQVRPNPSTPSNFQKYGGGGGGGGGQAPKDYPQNWQFLSPNISPNQGEVKNQSYPFSPDSQYQYRPSQQHTLPPTPPMIPAGYIHYAYPYCNPAIYPTPHVALYQPQRFQCPQPPPYPETRMETPPQRVRNPSQYPAGHAVRLALHKKLEEAAKKQISWFAPLPPTPPSIPAYQYPYQYQQQPTHQQEMHQQQIFQQQQMRQQQMQHQQQQPSPQPSYLTDEGKKEGTVGEEMGGLDSSTLSYPETCSSPMRPLATSSPNTQRLPTEATRYNPPSVHSEHGCPMYNTNIESSLPSWGKSMKAHHSPAFNMDPSNNNSSPMDTQQSGFTSNSQNNYTACDSSPFTQTNASYWTHTGGTALQQQQQQHMGHHNHQQQRQQQQRHLEEQQQQQETRSYTILYPFQNWETDNNAPHHSHGAHGTNFSRNDSGKCADDTSDYSYIQIQQITQGHNIPTDNEVVIPSDSYASTAASPQDFKMEDCPQQMVTTSDISDSYMTENNAPDNNNNNKDNNQEVPMIEPKNEEEGEEERNPVNEDKNGNMDSNCGNKECEKETEENRDEAQMLVTLTPPAAIFTSDN